MTLLFTEFVVQVKRYFCILQNKVLTFMYDHEEYQADK